MTTGESTSDKEHKYLYDWNLIGEGGTTRPGVVELDDETLRDGLQGPSVRQPTLDEKIGILHRMDGLGIHAANIGYAGADPKGVCRERGRRPSGSICSTRP